MKELIICTKQDLETEPVLLNGRHVESVEDFKYLGTALETHVSFSVSTVSLYSLS